jgi:predicted Zn-dependent protease
VFSGQAFAYVTIGYKLIDGVYDRQFTVPFNANYTYNGTTVDYGPIIRAAVTDWNNKVNAGCCWWSEKTDVYYTETTDYSLSELDFYVYEYGNTGWRGFTEYYKSSGEQINPGGYPTEDYAWNKAKLNVTYLHSNTSTQIQGTAGHEMGHALGLKHSGTTDAIMYDDYRYRSQTATTDDEDGVRAVY